MATMINRRIGFCCNCDANVIQVRAFRSRVTWILDRITFSLAGRCGLGPWRCVECGSRSMTLRALNCEKLGTMELPDAHEGELPVYNFLRTEHSLVHALTNADRFSDRFRQVTAQRIVSGSTTASAVSRELSITEREIRRWVESHLESETENEKAHRPHLIYDKNDTPSPPLRPHAKKSAPAPPSDGQVIDTVVRKSR